jgi:type IV secretion system protein TrbB
MSTVSALRVEDALRHALGHDVARILDEPTTTDLLLNADGHLIVDRLGIGRVATGHTMSPADALTALCLLADHCGVLLTRQTPILSATMPGSGERVAGTIPPTTNAPTFAIRRPPGKVFELDAFSSKVAGSFPPDVMARRIEEAGSPIGMLRRAVDDRMNIVVAGATGAGKTALLSALMAQESVKRDRCLILEDTTEIQCSAHDRVHMLTSPTVDMRSLVQLALRYRPDRIVVGEVRSGPAALEMIMAMNTGHTGSLTTIHANSCADAIDRIEDLCATVCTQTPTRAIRAAIGCVVFVTRTMTGRAIKEVVLI